MEQILSSEIKEEMHKVFKSSSTSGRRAIAQACSLRPISDASDYYLNHGTITRIYSKVSKKERSALKKKLKKEALNA